jgi:hypothetical protein
MLQDSHGSLSMKQILNIDETLALPRQVDHLIILEYHSREKKKVDEKQVVEEKRDDTKRRLPSSDEPMAGEHVSEFGEAFKQNKNKRGLVSLLRTLTLFFHTTNPIEAKLARAWLCRV